MPSATVNPAATPLNEPRSLLGTTAAVHLSGANLASRRWTSSYKRVPEVCLAWEKATQPASDAGIRVVHLRFGIVLSPHGGVLARRLPVFRVGMGGYLGSGRQWMSWVTLHDPIRAIEFAMETERLSGPLNVAAPNPLTNAQFTRTLGTKLHRPTPLRVPTLLLRIGFGEMMMATILESRRVMPARLRRAGFRFEQPVLAQALPALVYGP